jgi:hypothetical protein
MKRSPEVIEKPLNKATNENKYTHESKNKKWILVIHKTDGTLPIGI